MNPNFPVKQLVAAVKAARPDAQQPSIQAELTKLMKAGELERVGYGLYQSKIDGAKSTNDAQAPEPFLLPVDEAEAG